MAEFKQKHILILTAGFGEGHNSAARNLAAAMEQKCVCKVADPCAKGAPFVSNLIQNVYRYITTRHPLLWKRVYDSTEERDFSKQTFPPLRNAENCLSEEIQNFKPDAIVSTYPLYPYFLERIQNELGLNIPVFTVVTDSIEINTAWTKAPTNHFIVSDEVTRKSIIDKGVAKSKIHALGFPVHPIFSNIPKLTSHSPLDPFKILYFPTAKKPHVRRVMRAVLDPSLPTTELTVVLGGNFRRLYSRANEIKKQYPKRVKLKGWTRLVPELLSSHHLVIGKAGGATVHEAIAAHCPMLVHHLVPGQEEGNLTLLQQLEGGELIEDEKKLTNYIHSLTTNEGAKWKKMKENLQQAAQPTAAENIAEFVLKKTSITNTQS